MANITEVNNAIASTLLKQMEGVIKVAKVHGGRFDDTELRRYATKSPAIFVSILSATTNTDTGDEHIDADCQFGIFVLARDLAKKDTKPVERKDEITNIISTMIPLIRANKWGIKEGMGCPMNIQAANLYSDDLDKQAVNLWSITFSQQIRLGDGEQQVDYPLPKEIWYGIDPETGASNLDKYKKAN